jgi:hypothetical protein
MRSISTRQKSLFPPREKWTPPARKLSDHEQELLLGPSHAGIILKRLQLRDVKTKRWVTYSGANNEQSTRVSSSFVSLKQSDKPPQFGRINSIFTHTFAKLQTNFVELSIFGTAVFDCDVKMWSASNSASATASVKIIPLQDISNPLVVAREDNDIWFLNFSV